MGFLWDDGPTIVGNNDTNVSPYLKAWVKQGNVLVAGVIGEGTSKEVTANWNSPFEEDSLGGKMQKVGGIVQSKGVSLPSWLGGATIIKAGTTSKSLLSSEQIWEGNRPHSFNLVMKFYALKDARTEVMDPIRELEKMIAPEVRANTPGGRIPNTVMINIGRTALYPNCIIASMSQPLDKEKTKEGYLVRAEVTLQIETKTMLNRSDIDQTYG